MSAKNKLLKIEKDVPIPTLSRRGGVADLMRKMQIGDSFSAAIPKGGSGNFHTYARFAGIKIATRMQPDKKTRVWRIS